MGSIIIAMPKQEDAGRLGKIIKGSDIWEEVVLCTRGSDALHIVEKQDVSLIICTRRLKDMGYEELSEYLPRSAQMLLLTKDPSLVPYSDRTVRLLMPFKAADLIGTVKTLLPAAFYERRKKKPKRTPEEQKIIDSAKFILMDRNAMSEPDAFRYIQKVSMDSGRSMLETAQMILSLNG